MKMPPAKFLRKISPAILIFVLALLYVGSRIKIVEKGYEISQLKAEVAAVKRENGLLKSRVAQAKATSRLALSAKRQGFLPPRGARMLYIEE